MTRTRRRHVGWFWALAALLVAACGEDVEVGARGRVNQGIDGGSSGAGNDCQPSMCQTRTYACGDCIDNDGDQLTDDADPDCLGSCDNTEDSYYGGIPGQNNSPCRQDCYFDQDTGPGNDDCYWSHRCDMLSTGPDFPPSGEAQCAFDANANIPGTNQSCSVLDTEQSDQCESYCAPLTPNGCDCFGCCELPAGSANFVWLGSTVSGVGSCDSAVLGDQLKCKPCTPVSACLNSCETCELCVGKPSLPPQCIADAAPSPRCPAGVTACGRAGERACPPLHYCVTGCCRPVPQ